MSPAITGAIAMCRELQRLGVDTVFGLPGTQNVELFEALRTTRLRTVVATHELAASFMANGYARVSGRPGVLVTIPGPGFTYALTGLAEAFLDSTPLLHVVGAPSQRAGRQFALQAIDQRAMARPVVRQVVAPTEAADLVPRLGEAYALTQEAEPGPVLFEVSEELLAAPQDAAASAPAARPRLFRRPAATELTAALDLVRGANRILLYVGQGAGPATSELRAFAEQTRAVVVGTTSARGALPEDHPSSWSFDFGGPGSEALNEVVRRADLVLALGCKFSHNGAHGFRLQLPPEKLVQVDASSVNLQANYPARLSICADVRAFLRAMLDDLAASPRSPAGFAPEEVREIWASARARLAATQAEPRFREVEPPTAAGFFAALRRALPRDACLTTDSGLHQMLARRHFPVLSPGGLVVPTNFQSMGFGLPAAIGAKLAAPRRKVVALVGDGGVALSGLELLTAVRERIDLTAIVINDGHLGLIRLQQLSAFGAASGTSLLNPDFETLALAVGARYLRAAGDCENVLRSAVLGEGVSLVEVNLGDGPELRRMKTRALAKRAVRRFLPRWLVRSHS